MFELYTYNNKIPKEKYDKLYSIIIENYFEKNKNLIKKKDEINSVDIYNSWVNTITNTKEYNVLLYYVDNNIAAFITFINIERGLCLSEVQIKKEFQGKKILKTLLKEVMKNCNKAKSKTICLTINSKNIKSINVFTHIGFKNTNNNWYEINYEDLNNWIYKKY